MAESTGKQALAVDAINSSIAKTYDQENRGVPRLFARHISKLASPIDDSSVVHDNGCGPAVVTYELLTLLGDKPKAFRIEATDLAPPMIAAANEVIQANGWNNVTASVQDSTKLAFPDNAFTHSFVNFLVPIRPEAFSEIYRTLKPRGEALYTTWKTHNFSNLMHRCTSIIFPRLKCTEATRTAGLSESKLRGFFEAGGFRDEDVNVDSHKEYLYFKDMEDLMSLVHGPFGKFFTNEWNEEDLARLPDAVEQALTAEERESKRLEMVAWVVRARKS